MTQEAIKTFEEPTNTPEHHFNRAKFLTSHILRIEKNTRKLRGRGPVRVLDFGCGWGEFLAICERFGFVCCGVDRSSARRQNENNVKIFPEIEDVKKINDLGQGFHVATLFQVLEHLDSPLEILEALRNLLVPGGILIIETPDCTDVVNIKDESDYWKIHPLDHINAFTPSTLRNIAVKAGFQPINKDVVYITSDPKNVIINEIKRFVRRIIKKPKTQQYFCKI